jgi:hypothetical protein
VPGSGAVFVDVGRFVFDFEDGLVFLKGMHPFFEGDVEASARRSAEPSLRAADDPPKVEPRVALEPAARCRKHRGGAVRWRDDDS